MQFIFGFIAGVVFLLLLIWKMLPKKICTTQESILGFDDTIERIKEEAKKVGWNIPHVYDMKKSFEKAGNSNVQRMSVISLGNGKHAYEIVKHDKDKHILGFMPYRLGVYENSAGKVFITGAEMVLMSRIFGGNVAKVMGRSGKELADAFSSFTKS